MVKGHFGQTRLGPAAHMLDLHLPRTAQPHLVRCRQAIHSPRFQIVCCKHGYRGQERSGRGSLLNWAD